MTKHKSKRETRSDKFLFILHPTGQYCKKIKGKLYYFGTDKAKALQRYLQETVFLHVGRGQKLRSVNQYCPIISRIRTVGYSFVAL